MNDEGLADAAAANPFRLPRLHPGIGRLKALPRPSTLGVDGSVAFSRLYALPKTRPHDAGGIMALKLRKVKYEKTHRLHHHRQR
jgi:hypothetical protein